LYLKWGAKASEFLMARRPGPSAPGGTGCRMMLLAIAWMNFAIYPRKIRPLL